jgi:hypothetical protein
MTPTLAILPFSVSLGPRAIRCPQTAWAMIRVCCSFDQGNIGTGGKGTWSETETLRPAPCLWPLPWWTGLCAQAQQGELQIEV